MKQPKEVIAVFEAEEGFDKYTVVLDEKSCLYPNYPHIRTGIALSDNPDSAQGVCMFVDVHYWENDDNKHLGKKISWEQLPENVRKAVIEKLSVEA